MICDPFFTSAGRKDIFLTVSEKKVEVERHFYAVLINIKMIFKFLSRDCLYKIEIFVLENKILKGNFFSWTL